MTCNMGSTDRIIRSILAVLFIILIGAKAVTGTFAIILGVLAVVFIATSVVKFCPLYLLFKINTAKKD